MFQDAVCMRWRGVRAEETEPDYKRGRLSSSATNTFCAYVWSPIETLTNRVRHERRRQGDLSHDPGRHIYCIKRRARYDGARHREHTL